MSNINYGVNLQKCVERAPLYDEANGAYADGLLHVWCVRTLGSLFRQNGLMANSSKSHILTSPYERRTLKIHDSIITSSSSEELLGVLIDSELTFHAHITRLCSKANQKLSTPARVSKYMTLPKQRLLMSSYITSQFNYCPLVWMIHNRKLNKKINKVHERALRIVYGDHKTCFSNF